MLLMCGNGTRENEYGFSYGNRVVRYETALRPISTNVYIYIYIVSLYIWLKAYDAASRRLSPGRGFAL